VAEAAIVFAALDLGTSRLRLGVLDDSGRRVTIVADAANEVRFAAGGVARCRFSEQYRAVESHLSALSAWCRGRGVARLHLALCGNVSSLLRWDDATDAPVEDEYPIWMDTSCGAALPEVAEHWSGGRAEALLGTCMHAATNWLAVKARDHHRRQPGDRALIVQEQDAVFHRLTGALISHPSAQISLVDHRTLDYSPEMLRFTGLSRERLPALAMGGRAPLRFDLHERFALPPTTVHAGPQDTHAALLGFCAEDGDGMLLASTSEIVGVYESAARQCAPARMVRAQLGTGWIVYGSSSSGGSTVDWLMRSVLRRRGGDELDALTREAAAIAPGCDGLICLPYLGGERAPLWNSALTGSFIGLRPHHTDAHLLRAVLEGVALTRRQAAEALERELPVRFLAAGGGTANALWNRIRAAALGRPLAVMTTNDLSLIGAMRHAMIAAGADDARLRALLASSPVAPEPEWTRAYAELYPRFLAAQRYVAAGTEAFGNPALRKESSRG
jgi:sugar (pentulose or hexulose) kinase